MSIFIVVLYRHAHASIDGRDNNPQSCDVIKEYHFMSVMIMSRTHCLFNTALGWFMIHSKRMGCHLQKTGFGQMGVQDSSNRHDPFIGWVAFTKRWEFDTPGAFLKQGTERVNMMAQVHAWNEHFRGTKWVIVHLDSSA